MRDNIGETVGGDVATPKTDRQTSRMARGWNDAKAGRPFPRDYERWPQLDQINYEAGRRAAAAARAHQSRLPEWRPSDDSDAVERRCRRRAFQAAETEAAWGLVAP
ncbi:MAG: hypothetical protein U1E23_09540 [Reyranellaceae bacterium]